MRLARALAVCVSLALFARGAHADDRSERARADTVLGVTHAEAGRWEQALVAFEEAHRLDPQPSTLFNVAQARLKTHRARAAAEAYQALLAMKSALPQRQIESAERGLAQARASIGRITARASAGGGGSGAEGSELFVDDRPAGHAPVEVDPGPHVVRLVQSGREIGHRSVTVTEGQALDVVVEADPDPTPPASTSLEPSPAASSAASTASAEPVSAGPPVVAISLVAAGAVATGVGAFFGIRGFREWSDLKDGCSKTSSCDDRDIRDARRDALVGDILIGVGITAVAIGAYLWITAPSRAPRVPSMAIRF